MSAETSLQHGLSKLTFATDATPFFRQLMVVIGRNNLTLWRSPDFVFSRLFVHGFISLFISLSFLQLGHSVRDLQYRVFGMCVACQAKVAQR